MIVWILLGVLSALSLMFLVIFLQTAIQRQQLKTTPEAILLGVVTDFFDTLGIGSFAPTTAWMKFRSLAPDTHFPAIMNVGHALPTVTQALVFITSVTVQPTLLAACISASVIGALIGAPLVVRSPVRVVRTIVGIALLVAAALYAMKNLGYIPEGDVGATSLPPGLFAVAVLGHLILGVLMMFGIGLYAPSLIMLCLLGLNPTAVFPIMMGACAFLMPVSGMRFVKSDRIDLKIALGLTLGGIPAVLVAAFIVQSLNVVILRWGVIAVVLCAAVVILNAAIKPEPQTEPQSEGGSQTP